MINRRTLLVAAALFIGLVPILLMVYHVRSNWSPLPYWDEWQTPGAQFESWCRGTLTLREFYFPHNESRKFFPRLLYFALASAGGWDVRKEMTILFLEACLLSLLLWWLLRRTTGSSPAKTSITWAVMMFVCFSPAQLENFLWGVQLEPFSIGLAVVAAVAVNLSGLSFRRKTLINLSIALISTYTYAHGMSLWALAFPLATGLDSTSRRNRIVWRSLYLLAAFVATGCYFIGYERPEYHPQIASLRHQGIDLVHYVILWIGSYFASDKVDPLIVGTFAVGLWAIMQVTMLLLIRRQRVWQAYYPWIVIGTYAVISGAATAFGRVGFGVHQALDARYRVVSLFFYLALIGSGFAIYCQQRESWTRRGRLLFLIPVNLLAALTGLWWIWCYQEDIPRIHLQRENRVDLITALEWAAVIPDNPALASIFPLPDVLRIRALCLADHGLLRFSFVRGSLAEQVRKSPPHSDGSTGAIEQCTIDNNGLLLVTGWAWLPSRHRRADLVLIGCKDSDGAFKPISVLRTGGHRNDLFERFHIPNIDEAGFSRLFNPANLFAGDVTIQGWAIDLKEQKAYPLAGTRFRASPNLDGTPP